MKLKNKTIAFITAATLGISPAITTANGIPVIDRSQIMQSAANFAKEIAEMQLQLQQMKQQYAAITGSRNMGEILTDTGLKQALPEDWQKVYDSIQSGGYQGLDGMARALADAARLVDGCKRYQNGTEQFKTCQAAAVQTAQTQSYIMQALNNADDRLKNLGELTRKINQATDAKAIADLQARIGIEQAAIQNEQTRLQLFMRLSQERESMARKQAAEAAIQRQAAYIQELENRMKSR